MHASVLLFAATRLTPDDVRNRRILEVGSHDVNGSVGAILGIWGSPAEYVGVDITDGPGVDVVCSAQKLIDHFGEDSFDIVVSTEMLVHVRDWRDAVHNLKRVCKPDGLLLLTTRSRGFKYHTYPDDFWRYELHDMEEIFSDCEILANVSDPQWPGVFVKIRKPRDFSENDIAGVRLYSVITGQRQDRFLESDRRHRHFRRIQAKLRRRALRKRLRGSLLTLRRRLFPTP